MRLGGYNPPMRIAMTIAGSDSSGGAGLQADLHAFAARGVFGLCAVTAVTAQNTTGVAAVHEIPGPVVARQIDFTVEDIRPNAVKTGMLATPEMIETVATALRRHALRPYVCDPVMVAKSGAPLLRPHAVAALRDRLLPLATVITPNRFEAGVLLGSWDRPIDTPTAAADAARALVKLGCGAAVVKAVPAGENRLVDVVFDGAEAWEMPAARLPDGQNHGSGCAFAALLAAGLALGEPLKEAIWQAHRRTHAAIAAAPPLGRGVHPVNLIFGRA